MTTTVSQRDQPTRRVLPTHWEHSVVAPPARRAGFAVYGDSPDAQERQRMRQRHPVLLEFLTSAGFLGVVAVHSYLVTQLGWPGFVLGVASGFAWGLMFTFGVPSWLVTDLQVLRGHSYDELFPPRGPRVARQRSHRGAPATTTPMKGHDVPHGGDRMS
jgi:hypothetical protein